MTDVLGNMFTEEAIVKFALGVSVPVLDFSDEDKAVLCGTGFFYKIGERLFLISASHVFDDCNQEALAIPQYPHGGGNFVTIGTNCLSRPLDDILDVAVLEIQDLDLAQSISQNWTILDMGNTGDYNSKQNCFLLGFPLENMKPTELGYKGKPLPMFLKDAGGKPACAPGPAFSNVDIFLEEQETINKYELSRPSSLKGISGSAIWQVSEPSTGAVWAPAKDLKIVGVQCEVRNGDYVRGKKWVWVDGILNRL